MRLVFLISFIVSLTSCDNEASEEPEDSGSNPDNNRDAGSELDIQSEYFIEGICLDGTEQGGEDITDCEELDCLNSTGCCRNLGRHWIHGEFSECVDLESCKWETFPRGSTRHQVDGSWVVLEENNGAEVGMYTDPVVELLGEPLISFVAHFDPEHCQEDTCRQIVGLALTNQGVLSVGTGVVPTIGLIVDAEFGRIHLIINGRTETSLLPESFSSFTEPRGYALTILSDRRVAFWVGLPLSESSAEPTIVFDEQPHYTSTQVLNEKEATPLRVAVFGKLNGEGTARVGGVRVERPVCDIPNNFSRNDPYAVLRGESNGPVGRPSVIQLPSDEGLIMVYEEGRDLAVATSTDGVEWARQGLAFSEESATQYGRVARRAPTALRLDRPVYGHRYHLWFEAESEYEGTAAGDHPKFAILHAVSVDGIHWNEASDEDVALIGSSGTSWRAEVSSPSVVVTENMDFLMLFVGRHRLDRSTQIGWASSVDGVHWSPAANPISFEGGEGLSFERDGIDHPFAMRRGNKLHLWYTGYSGSRASIGYAVEKYERAQDWIWQRYGQVFEASQNWESLRVLAPSLLLYPNSSENPLVSDGTAMLHLWYTAGPTDAERIGVAHREIPTRVFREQSAEVNSSSHIDVFNLLDAGPPDADDPSDAGSPTDADRLFEEADLSDAEYPPDADRLPDADL